MAKFKHRFEGKLVEWKEDDVRVKFRDYFSMLHLYNIMYEWLIFEKWSKRDAHFPEELFLQRENPEKGREYWIWWRLEKKGMNSKYWRWYLDVDTHAVLVKDSEIMHNGKKYKTNWGQPDIKLYAKLVFDPDGLLQKSPLTKHFVEIFRKRIMKATGRHQQEAFKRELMRFRDMLKKYVQMKTYLPEEEQNLFFPDKSMGDDVI